MLENSLKKVFEKEAQTNQVYNQTKILFALEKEDKTENKKRIKEYCLVEEIPSSSPSQPKKRKIDEKIEKTEKKTEKKIEMIDEKEDLDGNANENNDHEEDDDNEDLIDEDDDDEHYDFHQQNLSEESNRLEDEDNLVKIIK